MKLRELIFNPFFLGIAAGLITGNLSLGLITTGLSIFLWGYERGINYIIVSTVLLVGLTGNINFEIIYLYFFTTAYLIQKREIFSMIDPDLAYFVLAIISLLTFPLWKSLLGMIPAQLLNEINISGEILLLAALVLSIRRGIYLIKDNKIPGKELVILFLLYLMAGLGIRGGWSVIPIWIVGSAILKYLEELKNELSFPVPLSYITLFSLVISIGYYLIPVNIIITVGLVILAFYIYLRQERVPLLEMVYLSVLLGIVAGRLGLLT